MSDSEAPGWVTVSGDEAVVWRGHPSLHLLTGTVVTVAVLVAGGAAAAAALPAPLNLGGIALVGIALLWLAGAVVAHRSTEYVITSREVYKKTGLLSRSVTTLRLDRVQNTSFSQSLLQRLLSYGDVRVDTAGSDTTELVLRGVDDPQEVSGLLSEQLDARRR
jgi:uncharacterized membrane protein YdbT with pleckstrin-like domain